MNELSYKGYIIEALPEQIIENKQWTINIKIWEYKSGTNIDKPYSASNTFPTKEEAIEGCFKYGMQIIDGQANCA